MKGAPSPAFWIVVALALLVSFSVDVVNSLDSGAIDLRNRITGMRLMEHGINPYTYKWAYGDPDIFCDVYNNPRLPVSKTTVTPTLLILEALPAALPYRAGQFAWLVAQWLMLLGTGWLWLRLCTADWQRAALALLVAGYTFTAAWHLHAERGQAYVLLAFFFAIWLALTLDRTWGRSWTIGLIAGFLITLRPTFALLVPFMAVHRRAQLIGVAAGVLVGVGAPMLVHPPCWQEYSAAMQVNSELYRNDVHPRPGERHYPGEVEGMPTRLLGKFAEIPYADFSFFALLKQLGVEHGWLDDQAWPAWPGLLVFLVGFALWLVLTRRREPEILLAALAAWVYLADLFLPAFRNSYGDVLMLDVLGAALVVATKIPWGLWPCAIALPFGLLVYATVARQDPVINFPTALLTVSALSFVIAAVPFKLPTVQRSVAVKERKISRPRSAKAR